MKTKWTKKAINEWYKSLPWLTGTNFLPSNVINRLDMWQSYHREEHLLRAEKELAFAEKLGFNTIRLWANFDVYYKEPKEFMKTLSRYIELARKYHQKVMMVLAYEEDLPFGNKFVAKKLGPQKLYYNHFNRDYVEREEHLKKGDYKHYLEYKETRPLFLEMVKKIVLKYKDDKIIFAWNVMNEPGNTLKAKQAMPILDTLFEFVRSLNPSQPLAADVWSTVTKDGKPANKLEQHAFDLSDFCSFHSYLNFKEFKRNVLAAKSWGKPVIVTEWLNRVNHNEFYDCYPWLNKQKIGSYIWGFIQGLTYTTEPWESIYLDMAKGKDISMFNITKWQHELFRTNFRPYDYKEFATLCKVNKIKFLIK
ncbi:MAG: cellulase family glycosylhydrolase [Bacilli bacterium]|nr:cellulase family glycosylhydrolase [Bacilli bacterium]